MTKILARNGTSNSYIIGDGDPNQNPMMPSNIADLDDGLIYDPPVPFQQHLKWGEFNLVPNDPALLKRLLALPRKDTRQKLD